MGRSPPPPFIDTRRGGVYVRKISRVGVFSPNRGRAVYGCCRKYTVEHWRVWRQAWQASWEPFSLAGIAPASCGSSGRRGGRCRRYRPLCPSWQSTEGSAGGVLLWSRSVPRSRVVPTLAEDPENSVRHVCTGCRRFPQSRNSAGDGCIVTGVGGRDSGHSCYAAWRPDAV